MRLVPVVLLLVLALTLSGCTSGKEDRDATGPQPSTEPSDDTLPDVPPQAKGLADELPRVEGVAADGDGGVDGVVYDTVTGKTIPSAQVFVTCTAESALLGAGAPIAVVPDAEGRFLIPAAPPFSQCPEWTYSVEAADYSLVVPLSHGPVVQTVWYSVYVGLQPNA